MQFPTDEQLVTRVLSGDRDAFRTLVERHYDAVYRLCYRVLCHRQDAEDATQEAFVRACNALPQYTGHGAFLAWLYRLTVNLCLNWRQSAASRAAARSCSLDMFEESMVISRDTPEETLLRADRVQQIHQALESLPAQQRTALALRIMEEMSYEEIAQTMGVPVNSVKSWVHRARIHLRDVLEEKVLC
ncbi:MAG: RNA polymerase sigma factor [Chthonomonadaceae bacterium]|nr:RNA polymerase sigma factor [Chthonomonadaceae bacterium]